MKTIKKLLITASVLLLTTGCFTSYAIEPPEITQSLSNTMQTHYLGEYGGNNTFVSIRGPMPENCSLNIKAGSISDADKKVCESLTGSRLDIAGIYDVSIIKPDSTVYQPADNNVLELSFTGTNIPKDKTSYVFELKPGSEPVFLGSSLENISVDALSTYAIAYESEGMKLVHKKLTAYVHGYTITAEGNMPGNARLSVTEVFHYDALKDVIGDEDYQIRKAFDIEIRTGSEVYQPVDFGETINITVTNPDIDEEELEVYRVEDEAIKSPDKAPDEAVTKVDAQVNTDGDIELETEHFTVYTFGSRTIETEGDTTATYLKTGTEFNEAIKKIINPSATYETEDNNIYMIRWSDEAFTSDVELQESGAEVYARGFTGYIPTGKKEFSHTANISDDGIQNGVHNNNLATKDVVSLPGADQLHVTLTYGTQNNYDMLYVFEGEYTGDVIQNMSAGQLATYMGGNNTTATIEFDIPGDTATFAFYSNYNSSYYGYYAIIEENIDAGTEIGGIELYTTATDIYANEDCSHMFESFNLLNSDPFISTLNMSIAKDFGSFYKNNKAIKEINLAFLDNSLADIFTDMVSGCNNLKKVRAPETLSADIPLPSIDSTLWYLDDNEDLAKDENTPKTVAKANHVYIRNDIENFMTAILKPGKNFNAAIKKLATNYDAYDTCDSNIKHITFTDIPFTSSTMLQKEGVPVYAQLSGDTVTIYTAADHIYFNTDSSYMFYYFYGLTDVEFLTWSKIDASSAANMSYMFSKTGLVSFAMPEIDTSNVTDMSYMFYYNNSKLKTLDLSKLDTSSVTNVSHMFCECFALTQLDITGFNTSNVTDMSSMFSGLLKMQSLNIAGFDTSNVTDMSGMFGSCTALTQLDVTGFDTSNVTDISGMFGSCTKIKSLDVTGFSTSNVTDMSSMFANCPSLESLDVTGFDTSNVTSMSRMFENCSKLQSLNVTGFDTSNVTNMNGMFCGCAGLTSIDVTGFDTSKVTDMWGMFSSCRKLTTIDLSSFNTFEATTMESMFSYCTSLASIDLSHFNTSNVITMEHMFYCCSALASININGINTSKVTTMKEMFSNCTSLATLDLSRLSTSSVTNMSHMFDGCSKLQTLDITGFNTSNVTDMTYMFKNCKTLAALNLSSFDTSKIKSMNSMFDSCESLEALDLSSFNTSNVTYMASTFSNCKKLTDLNLSSFNTSRVTEMFSLFNSCESLETIDLSTFNTAKVTRMDSMFYNCKKLTTLDLSGFNTANVTDMSCMFSYCELLESLDLSSFNTAKVTWMNAMFRGCKSLKAINVSTFDTSNTTKMDYMFQDIGLTELNLSNFNTSKVTTMGEMFAESKLEKLDISNFDLTKSTANVKSMLNECTNLKVLAAPKTIPSARTIQLPTVQNKTWYLDNDRDGITDSRTAYTSVISDLTNSSKYYVRSDLEGLSLYTLNTTLITGEEFNKAIKKIVTPDAEITTQDASIATIRLTDEAFTSDVELQESGATVYARAVYNYVSMETREYSHTANIDDSGAQNGNYANSSSTNEVITLPGAVALHITIKYGGESASYDYACMWEGSHPDYTAAGNSPSSITGRLGGGKHTDVSNTKEYDVMGDTVTFAFKSDSSGVGDGYGYYAVIEGVTNSDTINGIELYTTATDIYANEDCSHMFEGFDKLDGQSFINVDVFHKENIKNINAMFKNNAAVETLNLSFLDEMAITNCTDVLTGCRNLKKVIAPATFTKEELILPSITGKHWYLDDNEDGIVDNINGGAPQPTIINEHKYITGEVRLTITFDSNGGSEVAPVTAVYGTKIVKPTSTKARCMLEGWYIDEGLTTKWNFEKDVIVENITLHAKWVLSTFVVTFDGNGGSSPAAQQINNGQKAVNPGKSSRTGHIFKGWKLEDKLYDFNTPVTADITLKADWEEATCEIAAPPLITMTSSYNDCFTVYSSADPDKNNTIDTIRTVFGYLPVTITGNFGEGTTLEMSASWKLFNYEIAGQDEEGKLKHLTADESSLVEQIVEDADTDAEFASDSFIKNSTATVSYEDLPDETAQAHVNYLLMQYLPEIGREYTGNAVLSWSIN